MTGSFFATGRGVPPSGRDHRPDAHAVARPVVDGLEASVCGVLVVAAAGEDWPASGAHRCEECARVAG
jgi:hypothetical protein